MTKAIESPTAQALKVAALLLGSSGPLFSAQSWSASLMKRAFDLDAHSAQVEARKDIAKSTPTPKAPSKHPAATISLPRADEIAKLTANPEPTYGQRFPDFNVPREYIDPLLDALRPATINSV